VFLGIEVKPHKAGVDQKLDSDSGSGCSGLLKNKNMCPPLVSSERRVFLKLHGYQFAESVKKFPVKIRVWIKSGFSN
jgi:hypothetical protein